MPAQRPGQPASRPDPGEPRHDEPSHPRPAGGVADQPAAAGPQPAEISLGAAPPAPGRLPRSRLLHPVLPETTSDETGVGWGDWPERDDDERLLREVPPHHGTY